jgi:hypothetical protein
MFSTLTWTWVISLLLLLLLLWVLLVDRLPCLLGSRPPRPPRFQCKYILDSHRQLVWTFWVPRRHLHLYQFKQCRILC